MNKNLKLIALVGMPGAGKSEAANFFREKGFPVLRFGDQVDIGLAENKLERNAKNEQWYREKLRKELGMAAMAIKIEPRVLETAKKFSTIILDGLYSWEEYTYLTAKFPKLFLLCIYAPPSIRYKRLSIRKVRPLTPSEARVRDFAEIENLNKGGPIALADYVVCNWGNLKEFFGDLSTFSKKYL